MIKWFIISKKTGQNYRSVENGKLWIPNSLNFCITPGTRILYLIKRYALVSAPYCLAFTYKNWIVAVQFPSHGTNMTKHKSTKLTSSYCCGPSLRIRTQVLCILYGGKFRNKPGSESFLYYVRVQCKLLCLIFMRILIIRSCSALVEFLWYLII